MTVHYTVEGPRATVRLDRPDVLNALDRSTIEGIRDAMRGASADHAVGVVVVTGTGERAFCTGADLDEQKRFLDRPNDYWDWMGRFIEMIEAVRGCAKPVVARLNGMVVGGGNELNIACDLAVAADDVVFRHVGPSRGSLPSGGATQWMPLLVGDRRAREVIMLNRPISAQTALDWGWVNRVVPRTELDATVDDICEGLLEKMPEIIRATKVELDFWKDLSWGATIRMAREWLTIHAASREVAEGLASFEEKRGVDYDGLRRSIQRPAAEKSLVSDRVADRVDKPRIRVDSPATDAATGDQVDGVALVTLDRPEVLNALDYETLRQLVEALEALDADDGIRAVVITGAGERAFAAGADIKEMAGATPVSLTIANSFARWERLRRIRKPLIAAVRGFALGGGCELAMACDLIVAGDDAVFGQPEIRIGIMPGAGGTQRLTRALGKTKAMEMILTGAQLPAVEAAERGLVSRVVAREQTLPEALALAAEIASQPPLAVMAAKEAVNRAFELSLEAGLEFERRNFFLLFASEDQKEGMAAFVEKRPPGWKGR